MDCVQLVYRLQKWRHSNWHIEHPNSRSHPSFAPASHPAPQLCKGMPDFTQGLDEWRVFAYQRLKTDIIRKAIAARPAGK